MTISKAPSVTAGVAVNPNALTRSIARTYENMAETINGVADIFVFGDRCPVAEDDLSLRWDWTTGNIAGVSTINDFNLGLDGTSLYLYGSSDYALIDPLFLVYNVIDNEVVLSESRPATIYESMMKMRTYIHEQIASNISPLIALTRPLEDFLASAGEVLDGTAVVIENDELSLSTWRFTEYEVEGDLTPCLFNGDDTGIIAGDDLLILHSSAVRFDGGPLGGAFAYDTDGLTINTGAEALLLESTSDIVLTPALTMPVLLTEPSTPPADYIKIYYNGTDSTTYVMDENGVSSALGAGGSSENYRLSNNGHFLTLDADGMVIVENNIWSAQGPAAHLVSGYVSANCPTAGGIVYTAGNSGIRAVKLFLMIEGIEDGGDGYWETQTCEVIVAMRFGTISPSIKSTTYGVTHTGAGPLATVSAIVNSGNRIEVIVTPTSASNSVFVSGQVSDLYTRD